MSHIVFHVTISMNIAIMGIIADRWPARCHTGLLIHTCVVTITIVMMPYMTSFGGLLTTAIIQGFSFGSLELLGNILLIRLHREDVGPYRQTLSFCFGFGDQHFMNHHLELTNLWFAIGAFIGPLLAEPFLGDSSMGHASIKLRWAFLLAGILLLPGVVVALLNAYMTEWKATRYTQVGQETLMNNTANTPAFDAVSVNDANNVSNIDGNNDSTHESVVAVTSDSDLSPTSTSSLSASTTSLSSEGVKAKKATRPVTSQRWQVGVLTLVTIFLFCYVGSELGYGTFLYTYTGNNNVRSSCNIVI
jgi:hypothetical protein